MVCHSKDLWNISMDIRAVLYERPDFLSIPSSPNTEHVLFYATMKWRYVSVNFINVNDTIFGYGHAPRT